MSSSLEFLLKFHKHMHLRCTCGDFCVWFCWIWLFCKFSCCVLWFYRCLSLYGGFCVVAWDLLFSSKSVCLFIGVVMISFLESNSVFKLAIFCCNVLVFWFWQHSIFSTVLVIFPSMIQIFFVLLWAFFLSGVLVVFQIFQTLLFWVC